MAGPLFASLACLRLQPAPVCRCAQAEEDLAEQVDLVNTLSLEYDYLDDDEDAPPAEKIPTEG